MKIISLKLNNFRNYQNLELTLNPGINIFIGENGVGKTNILESIYVLALTKTNRDNLDSDMIKFNENFLKIEGKIESNGLLKNKEININKNKKKLFINKKEIRKHCDYVKDFSVISFSPMDLNVIKGSPSIRRSMLNIDLSELDNTYIKVLNEYNQIIKMRNEYLKRMSINGNTDERYLEIINEEMINKTVIIYKNRLQFIDKINMILPNIFKKITGLKDLKIQYNSSIGIDKFDEIEIRKKMKDKTKKLFNIELIQGSSMIGPHRDDFSFLLNNIDMKSFSSEGQQRLAVIALKISEIYIFKEVLKEYPVLLLDDVFSEIDIKKRNKIVKYLKSDIQVIITTTDLEDIEDDLVNNAKVFKIKNGKIKGGAKCKKKK